MNGYFKILLAACIWGTLGIFARWSGIPANELVFYKTFVASISLLILLPREKLLIANRLRAFIIIILAGILYAITAILFMNSIYITTMSNALFAFYIKPIIVALLLPIFFREKPNIWSILATLVSLIGLGLILTPSIIEFSFSDIRGVLLALFSAITSSSIVVLVKLIDIPSPIITYYAMIAATLLMIPFIDLDTNINLIQVGFIIIIGFIHTAIPYILYFSGLRSAKTSHGITLTYFDPVVASFAGVLLFQEPFSILTLIGSCLIIISGALIISH
ncbi:DMT family transporter [Natranaerobius trueperi]|uniref:EamA domain-containing protein n=1 Tax=Natranaerobius trueperi TaxID=759412 RepID=A0A226BY38_9FIRM|nr:EamA family transporter [Natranaerobius trueperi]OWZ83050.1 hypothetical protein CDO51_10835 [Natranaerobius trueperi]